ncbi:hypothetical protein JCM13664_10630 [Methylothermus subterraneus]
MILRLVALLIAGWLATASATSVREVSLQEMLERAELVFEGEVVRVRGGETLDQRPFTRIEFRVLDVIKGRYERPTLTLDFLGGESGAKRLAIEAMDYPALGERGIYFVESLTTRLVHPLYGWSQGHFVAYPDESGRLRVRAANGQPVTQVEFAPAAGSPRLSRGVAKGVLTRRDAQISEALSLEEFKKQLRQHLPR